MFLRGKEDGGAATSAIGLDAEEPIREMGSARGQINSRSFAFEQFLTNLDGEMQKWVRRHQPQLVEEALHLTESFTAAERARVGEGGENGECDARGTRRH